MTALKRIFRHNSMCGAHMSFEPERVANTLPTDFTFRTFVDVILMRFQSTWSTKGTVTLIALFWSVFFMLHFDVFFQISFHWEIFRTYIALVGFPKDKRLISVLVLSNWNKRRLLIVGFCQNSSMHFFLMRLQCTLLQENLWTFITLQSM